LADVKKPGPTTVLLANGHTSVAQLIGRIFAKLGRTTVETAATADDALGALQSLSFDIVLVDDNIGVPDMGEYLDKVRHANGAQDALVLLSTSSLTATAARRAVGAGVDAILLKPFSPEDLRVKLGLADERKRRLAYTMIGD
jgi:two-component system, chemotaxis family, chemotaxis protein CheY